MSWELKKLSELCEIQPKKAEVKDALNDSDSVSFMGMDKLGIDTMYAISDETRELSAVYKSYTYFQENDVLLAKITPCFENGKLGIAKKLANGVGFGSSEFTVYRCSNKLINKYLYYFLNSELFRQEGIKSMSGAVGHKRVRKEYLTGALIPLPSVQVQKQIVEKLDAALANIDKAISATEKNIENAESLFNRYLDSIFEVDKKADNYKKIKDIALVKGGKRVPKGFKLLTEKTQYPYLRVTDFNDNGGIDDENLQYINEEIFSQIKNYTISSEDLYISIAGTIGKSGIVPKHLSGANLTENACKLVFKEGTTNKFFYYFTKSSSFYYQAIEQTRVAGQPKLALTRLKEIKLILPSVAEQEILLERLSELERIFHKLREIYTSKISYLTVLKSSILNQAFSGELTKGAA